MSNFSSEEMGVPTNLVLASWTDRFIAWLIDFIIVSIGLAILFAHYPCHFGLTIIWLGHTKV